MPTHTCAPVVALSAGVLVSLRLRWGRHRSRLRVTLCTATHQSMTRDQEKKIS